MSLNPRSDRNNEYSLLNYTSPVSQSNQGYDRQSNQGYDRQSNQGYDRDRKQQKSKTQIEEEESREILSSFVDKPEFENFEKGRGKAVQQINKKYSTLIKAEQEIQADIDDFNNEMGVLLNLKDVHKQPFDLTDIKIERLNASGLNASYLPLDKPNGSGTTQFFSILKCGSEVCNGKHTLMSIYQFDNNNQITDKYLEGKNYKKGTILNASSTTDTRGNIKHIDVQYITSNFDEAYTEAALNNYNDGNGSGILNLLRCYHSIDADAKYNASNDSSTTAHYNIVSAKSVYTTQHNASVIGGPKLSDYCLYAGDFNFKCGCMIHSKKYFSEFGIKTENKTGCEDKDLISRNNNIYNFHPISGKYSPKTIFFCSQCKQFMRYECLKEINMDPNNPRDIIKMNPTEYYINALNASLDETLPIITPEIMFRVPLFKDSYNDHLENTARSLKASLIAELQSGNLNLKDGSMMLGEIVGNIGDINIDYKDKKWLFKRGLKAVAKSVANIDFSQSGGSSTSSTSSEPAKAFLNFGNQYGKLKLQKNYDEFEKELKKWSVCKDENIYLQSIKSIKSDKTEVSENDKKPFRAKFFSLQQDYVSDFETIFPDTMRKYFPFISDDFSFLRSLTISGDKDGLSPDVDIKLWGNDYKLVNLQKEILKGEEIKVDTSYKRLDNNIALRIKNFPKGETVTEKEIFKVAFDINFNEKIIRPGDKLYPYMYIPNVTQYLEQYGNINTESGARSYILRPNVNASWDAIHGYLQNLNSPSEYDSNASSLTPPLNQLGVDSVGHPLNVESGINDLLKQKLPYVKYKLDPNKINMLNSEEPFGGVCQVNNCWTLFNASNASDTSGGSTGFRVGENIEELKKLHDAYGDGGVVPGADPLSGRPMKFTGDSNGRRIYKTVKDSLNNLDTPYRSGLLELENKYKREKDELLREYKGKYKDKEPDIKDPKFKNVVQNMCGGNSGVFWYGDTESDYKFQDYQRSRSILARLGILYLPWYDTGFVEEIMKNKLRKMTTATHQKDFLKLDIGNLKGLNASSLPFNRVVKDFNGSLVMYNSSSDIGDLKEDLLRLKPTWNNYRKQVLSLFPLLYPGDSRTQFILNDNASRDHIKGLFRITQLKSSNSFLSGCYSLDIDNIPVNNRPNIWIEPKTKDGLIIKTPIQILRLKQKIKDKALKYYEATESLKSDKLALKKYEKEYAEYLKNLEKSKKAKEKEEEKIRKEELKALKDKEKQDQAQGRAQGQLPGQLAPGQAPGQLAPGQAPGQLAPGQLAPIQAPGQLAPGQLAPGQLAPGQLSQTEQIGLKDKLYTEEDISNVTSELNNLKREMKRKEEVLKNITYNIKLLKYQRHGEDSEQRQIQQRDYEKKSRELILIQKLVEQREEKLKVLKILTDKLSLKNEVELSEMMRRDEINKQQNFLALQNEMNNITGNKSREMSDSLSSVQNDEISQLQNKLTSLEGDEIDIQHELVQNGGGRKRKDKLSELLYKTDSRKNRTKKKGRNKRNNERKKDRSLRKRV